ncbi:MAG TPA: LysM domain-containing protein [Baekduia sp.]|nr:LysM domain-containing protein [Baekduia sp.]
MRNRSPARWLAPLALVICAVAAYTVVQNGTSSGDDGTPTSATTTTKAKTTSSRSGGGSKKKSKRTYTVKSGDNLSSIADANGTTVEELQTLNPSVDAASLHVGQKIRLPR